MQKATDTLVEKLFIFVVRARKLVNLTAVMHSAYRMYVRNRNILLILLVKIRILHIYFKINLIVS